MNPEIENSVYFKNSEDFERWLSKNHDKSNGIWMRMHKKNSKMEAIKGPEMLDALLCYGWITGQARKGDENFALWWICPRRKGSIWSKVNVGHAERLIKERKMNLAGINAMLSLIPCWKIISCSEEDRNNCEAYKGNFRPCWSYKHMNNICATSDCKECIVYKEYFNCNNFKQKLQTFIK